MLPSTEDQPNGLSGRQIGVPVAAGSAGVVEAVPERVAAAGSPLGRGGMESKVRAAERRNLGMVFQSYAVWPHMTVFDNLAFPLRVRKQRKKAIRDRVHEQALVQRPARQLDGNALQIVLSRVADDDAVGRRWHNPES